jgi:hypothetical protein
MLIKRFNDIEKINENVLTEYDEQGDSMTGVAVMQGGNPQIVYLFKNDKDRFEFYRKWVNENFSKDFETVEEAEEFLRAEQDKELLDDEIVYVDGIVV